MSRVNQPEYTVLFIKKINDMGDFTNGEEKTTDNLFEQNRGK